MSFSRATLCAFAGIAMLIGAANAAIIGNAIALNGVVAGSVVSPPGANL